MEPVDIDGMNRRFWPKVQKTDSCWLWIAALTPNGYGKIWPGKGRGRMLEYAHRVSWAHSNGPIPDGLLIDHICHNRACVNPDHLRVATHKQNLENRSGLHPKNVSGFSGVAWHKHGKKWRAEISHHGKKYYLGLFLDPAEAGRAADAKRAELFTHSQHNLRSKPLSTTI